MDPITPESRVDLILKTIQNSENIGFNQIHRETKIPKKTLSKYLKDLKNEGTISKEKTGKNRGVKYYVNFNEDTKKAIKHNLAQRQKPDLSFYETKYRKSNIFPHFLQGLAAEYYQNMISYLFWSVPSYKYSVKRIEEILEIEREKLEKEFTKKEKVRLSDACQAVQWELSGNVFHAEIDAGERNMHRTRDEVIADCNAISIIERGIHHNADNNKKYVRAKWGLDNHRINLIEDEKTKELFIKLANEYNELAKKLRNIKYRLSGIIHGPPWEPSSKAIGSNEEILYEDDSVVVSTFEVDQNE